MKNRLHVNMLQIVMMYTFFNLCSSWIQYAFFSLKFKLFTKNRNQFFLLYSTKSKSKSFLTTSTSLFFIDLDYQWVYQNPDYLGMVITSKFIIKFIFVWYDCLNKVFMTFIYELNFVLVWFYNYFDLSVTDEYYEDETRV